jgi:hypothetical protein
MHRPSSRLKLDRRIPVQQRQRLRIDINLFKLVMIDRSWILVPGDLLINAI